MVRRRIPRRTGPTGGPAFTDVLGVAEQWDPTLVVRREDGTVVEIPHDLIVSGKPVPPRTSPLMRNSDAEVQRRVRAMWPGETAQLGDWLLQVSPPHSSGPAGSARLRRRANSALAYGSPGIALADAAGAIIEWYGARERVPLASVAVGSAVDEGLRALGWAEPDDFAGHSVSVQLASLARVRRALAATCNAVLRPQNKAYAATDSVVTPRYKSGGDPDDDPDPNRATVQLRGQHARGTLDIDGDWACLHDLHTEAVHRRRGHAYAVLDGLLEPAAERGVRTIVLHVLASNAPALALYERLGFAEHHTATYLTPR